MHACLNTFYAHVDLIHVAAVWYKLPEQSPVQRTGRGDTFSFVTLRSDSIKVCIVGGRIDHCLLIAVQVRKENSQHRFKTGVTVGGVSDHVLLTSRSLIRAGLDLCL